MSERNLFDEAARILAMPIPRRKALTYVAAGFAGSLLPFLWPKEATATGLTCGCSNCGSNFCCSDPGCNGRPPGAPCTVAGRAGHCTKYCKPGHCCRCVAGSAPAAPDPATIPDVAITPEASLAAGNCQEGTDFVASWFPGKHSVSAREAAAEAIARGEPWLAREIARTAHLVHRSAQV